jgi:uncharacterized YceG family protein
VTEPTLYDRERPSRRQVAARRAVALLLLAVGFGVAAWLGSLALGGASESEPSPPPPPTTTRAAPAPKPLRIVFPEGFTRREMAQRITAVNRIAKQRRKVTTRLKANRFLALTDAHPLPGVFAGDRKRRHLEGFLFPATYEFTAKMTTAQLLDRVLGAFQRNWATVDLEYAQSKNLTAYDVLIIASMVERETVAPEERPLVAAVIYNRLKAGMPLGIDATIRYGLNVPGTEPLRESHLESDNPYNTRELPGLPPTPIANPGLASIRAAAQPARKNFLFFVRKPDKVHHFFTASEDEFYRKSCEYGYGC